MGYNDFFQREDVYEIIIETISNHYQTEVRMLNSRNETNPSNLYFCLPLLNVIYRSDFSRKEIMKFVKSNMVGNQSFFSKLLIKFYIILALMFPVRFSDKLMEIQNNSTIDVIYPGNKKLKILNFTKKSITNILKSGFDNEWLNNEINFRNRSKFDFVLKIDECGTDYYVERMLIGKPIARLKVTNIKGIFPKVLNYMEQLAVDSKTLDSIEYAHKLSSDIELLLKSVKEKNGYDDEHTEAINELHSLILNNLVQMNPDLLIEIHTTHGDLQKGNIFIDNNQKIYILDWETVAVRLGNYDKIIYKYDLRNSYNLILNFKKYINIEGSNKKNIVELYLFILEDLKWYLKEATQLKKGSISIGLQNYSNLNIFSFITSLHDSTRY